MRLIDADKAKLMMSELLQVSLHEGFTVEDAIEHACICIDNQPTAYDVDKVVEQLEEERELSYADFDRYVDEVSPCLDAEYDDFFHRGLERAIKIVKGGGVDAGGI